MSKALPYIAAAGTFLATGSFQAAQAAFVITSLAVNALDPPKKPGAAERQASVTTLSLGEQSRELLIGETCTAGTLVDAFNFGGKYGTDTVTRCIAVADHAIDSVVGYYIGDQYYPWTVDGIQPGFSNKLSIRFYNATPDGHAPQAHVLAAGWSASDRLAGMAVFWVDTQYDEKVWPQGHPQLKFVLRGLRAYDMRFDPAFGYSGPNPQTWEDRASHVHTRNAAILRYAFTRGIYAEGHQGDPDHLLIGRGLTAEEAPPERIIAAANLCDEIMEGGARYTANGVIRASDAFITVEEMFSAAMAGQIVQREGGVEVEPGQAKAAVVTITDGALVVGEPVSFSAFLPDTDGGRINSVSPRYVSPAQNWRDFAGPVRRDVADIAADGGPREATLSLLLVTDGAQADRCAEIMRKAARLERRATIVLPPEYANLEEGDWIAWRSDRYHHGATVRYRIESWTLDEKWRMRLSLREIASSVFGVPDPVEDAAPSPPPPPVPVDALFLDGVTAEAITLPGDTSAMPAVRFTWSTPVDAAVLAIRAEVRRAGETEIATGRADDISLGGMVMSNGVPADAAIEVRLVPIGDPSRPVLASPWVTLSTTSLVAGDVSATSPVATALRDAIEQARADLEAAQEVADDQIDALNADINAAETGLKARTDALFSDVNTPLTGLKARSDSMFSDINTATTGLKAKTDALLATLNAPATGLIARVAASETAITDNNTATVARLNVLDARNKSTPNLILNGGFTQGVSHWGKDDGAVWTPYTHPTLGRLLDFQSTYIYTEERPIPAGEPLSVSFEGSASGYAQVQWIPSYEVGGYVGYPAAWGTRSVLENQIAPPGTTAFRVVFHKGASSSSAYLARVKVNYGATAGNWSDEATDYDTTARLSLAETAITTNNSASVERISLLETTLNTPTTGVSARLALIETTVTTPLTGLAARTSALETKISAPGTGLDARLGTAEGALVDLGTNKASVESVRTLEARARTVPNLIVNGDFSSNTTGFWGANDDSAIAVPSAFNDQAGWHTAITGVRTYITTKVYPASAGIILSLSYDGQATTPTAVGAYIQWTPSYQTGATIVGFPADQNVWEVRKRSPSNPAPAPAGTTGFRVVMTRNGSADFYVSRVKVNMGGEAADWSDDASIGDSRARMITVENVVTTATTGLVSRTSALEATVDTPTTGVKARLGSVETVVTAPTTGLVSKVSVLETSLTTPTTGVLARLGTLETTITTPTSGLAAKVTALETAINTPLTGLSARIGASETAISNLDTNKASAERVSFLEVYNRTSANMVVNSDFSQAGFKWSAGPAWAFNASGGELGSYAVTYAAGGQFLISDPIRVQPNSDYGLSVVGDGGSDYSQAGAYITEFADNGSNAPGAVLRDGLSGFTMVGASWDKQAHGAGFTSGGSAQWVKVCLFKNGETSYAAFSRVMLHRSKAPVAWNDNQTETNSLARLIASETAITTNNTAAVNRLESLEATVNTPTTGVSARLGSAESAIASLTTGKASAERVSFLEVRTRTSPNLIPNSTANAGLKGWFEGASKIIQAEPYSYDGARFICYGLSNHTSYLETEKIGAGGNVPFSFQVEIFAGGISAGSVRAYVAYFNAANVILTYQIFDVTTDKSWYPYKSENFVSPAGTTYVRVYMDVQSATLTVAGWRRLKFELGSACSFWSDDATDIMTTARLTTAESAITTNNTAAVNRLQVLEAAVTTPLTGLSAKVASHDSAIANLETGKASASSVQVLEVRSQTNPNLLPNPDFNAGLTGWYEPNPGTTAVGPDQQVGQYARSYGDYVASDPQTAFAGMTVSFSFDGESGGAASSSAFIQWLPSYAYGGGISNFDQNWGVRKHYDSNNTNVAPAGTTHWRIVFQRNSGAYLAFTRVKVNFGSKATAWSRENADLKAYAKITETSSVALDAQGKANAARTLLLDVNGYVSGTQSINNGATAAFNVLADAFSIIAPGGGDRTEYLAAYGCWFVYTPLSGTRTRYGRAFNSDQKIVWWTGPDTVPVGSETKANAYVYMSQNTTGGLRFGGSDTAAAVETGFVIGGTPSPVLSGIGSATANISATATGETGTLFYRWTQTGGDPCTIANPDAAFTSVNCGTTTGAVASFQCIVSDDLKTRVKYVRVRFRSTV